MVSTSDNYCNCTRWYYVYISIKKERAIMETITDMDILLIALIMYIITLFLYFKFKVSWFLTPTILLWFVPIFIVDNLFIKIFSVIMIIISIVITLFNGEEDY